MMASGCGVTGPEGQLVGVALPGLVGVALPGLVGVALLERMGHWWVWRYCSGN